MDRFNRNPNVDNQERNVAKYEQAIESNYQLNYNNVIWAGQ